MPSCKPFKTNDGRLHAPVGIACPRKDLLQAAPSLDLLEPNTAAERFCLKSTFSRSRPGEGFTPKRGEDAKTRVHGSMRGLIPKITLDGNGVVHIFSLGVVLPYPKTALHVRLLGIEEEFPPL